MKTPYLQYKAYMRERYGEPLFRVPIDFNLGCPNRETDGSGGCTFCNARGSKAVQTLGRDSVEEQMAEAIRFARERYGAKKFMAYIQAFSATFGPKQRPRYLEMLNAFEFAAVSIGTRPDCLTSMAYDFLINLNKEIEVWVELGVQTVHDRTLKRINRGHDWAASERAIRELHDSGIKVAVHTILGLPGETAADFRQTAETLAALPIDAVKVHNLHIEQGTTLALEHALTPLPVFMEYEFAEHLMDFMRRLPPDIPIMRLTTDTLDDELIAPKWHMAKGQFKDYVIRQMICREWRQGDLSQQTNLTQRHKDTKEDTGKTTFSGDSVPVRETSEAREESFLKVIETEDGSVTFWNEEYREHYHTPVGARMEAEEKYLVPGKLKERLSGGDVQLLDVCFGLGHNSLAALNMAAKGTRHKRQGIRDRSMKDGGTGSIPSMDDGNVVPPKLSITALEMDRRVVKEASRHLQPVENDTFNWNQTLTDLYLHQSATIHHQSSITMHWGDARHTITTLDDEIYDLVFLDAFSTQRNSELWTVDFFRQLKRVMQPDAVLLTYCAAIPIRAGLIEAGFYVGETDPVGRARGGTIAAMRKTDIKIPLPDHEISMIRETTRGLPYRDPYGVWTNKEILRDRQERILERKEELSSNP